MTRAARWAARWARRARGLLRGEDGTATIEFVILFPLFLLVMVNAIEASVLMTRGSLLDRGLDLAVRELRLQTGAPPSYEEFRALICRGSAFRGCLDTLQVELRPIDLAAGSPLDASARCSERADRILPLVKNDPAHYRTGAGNQLMMVRACLVVEPVVPNLGLATLLPGDEGAGFRLISVSAFVHEPRAAGATSQPPPAGTGT